MFRLLFSSLTVLLFYQGKSHPALPPPAQLSPAVIRLPAANPPRPPRPPPTFPRDVLVETFSVRLYHLCIHLAEPHIPRAHYTTIAFRRTTTTPLARTPLELTSTVSPLGHTRVQLIPLLPSQRPTSGTTRAHLQSP